MNNMIARGVAPLLAALLLTACATPAFQQPAIDTPTAFRESQVSKPAEVDGIDGARWKPAQPAEQQPRGQWWLAFNDRALTALVNEASANNANLAVAAARVEQARAIAGIANADRMPQVGIGIGAQRARPAPLEVNLPQGSATPPQTSYTASLTASYEVDLFGRVAAGVSAARGDAATSEANYRSVLLALQADVAQTYFRLRALDAETDTVAQTVRLRDESVKVTQRRFDLGDIGEFDLSRARTELATARAEAIGLERQRATAEHALAVLLGKPAAHYVAGTSPLLDATALPAIPAGLPSTLLERRPDIVAAQRTMEASNARIGVARGAMFPALTISAAGGGLGGAFSEVFKWSSRSWVLGLLTSMPIIDGGRNRANVEASYAVLEESVGGYRQSVLTAFAEVEDNLAGLRILSGQAEQIDAAVLSARRSADLAQKLYDAGRSSYLELLDAQRNLASVERTAVQLRGNRAVTTVALIRSLGGGWDAQPVDGRTVAQN
ncbi:efflux transporter outer membrane subunit [Massilia yuzhufengensis]|uniref:Outer membrane protein, multidrug efflux system n=1 Tax=Massilia yuzhufengensis TaxID=1164594 RepID=A0A1I1Q332_9BURK|nr:efflux transporter outer membrane subunit [Massilia yuzhufengensis]SFD16372.1 outer membrane protein, multidrug efflux system [Massilia yuzhufengensis]